MRLLFSTTTSALILIGASCIHALDLDLTSKDSINSAALTVAQSLLQFYNGTQPGQTPGIIGNDPDTYWWESGAAWEGLIHYWNYTGDDRYNSLVQQALLWQMGPNNDFMPPNQTKAEGNNDQSVWALAAMTAAELQFPTPSTLPNVTWVHIASNVFDLQVARWDTQHCGGGLRWQIFTFNKGYDYKNTASTGLFFQLAARLARYTGNQTYADWADKSFGWIKSSTLITSDFEVYDGASISSNCSSPNELQWTYNAADFLYGSAIMYNLTNGSAPWKEQTQGFLSAMSVFANKQSILREIACEPQGTCNYDQYTFKGIAAQSMGATIQVAPFTADTIMPYLQASAKGAAASCSGDNGKIACSFEWTSTKPDGKTGFGPQLSALNVILANLAANSSAPLKATTSQQNQSSTGSSSANSTSSTSSTSPTGSPSPSGAPPIKASSGSPRFLPLQTAIPTLFVVVAMAFFMM